jgi:hypothetical protein
VTVVEHLLTTRATMIYGSLWGYAFPEIIDRFGPRSQLFAATKLEQSA